MPTESEPIITAQESPATGPHQMSIVVISPNDAYRSSLLAVLSESGLSARAAFIGPEGDMSQPGPVLEPQVVVVDGNRIADVPSARRIWPRSRLICSLDYIDNWERVRSLGADICVLKDRGLTVILAAVTQSANTTGTSTWQPVNEKGKDVAAFRQQTGK